MTTMARVGIKLFNDITPKRANPKIAKTKIIPGIVKGLFKLFL